MAKDDLSEKWRHARDVGDETIISEEFWHQKTGEVAWDIYRRGVDDYSNLFERVLPGGISRFVSEALAKAPQLYALDAFGEGNYLRDLRAKQFITGGASFTLTDLRRPADKDFDRDNGLELILGNVYRGAMWGMVGKYLERQKIQGFNLIICAPAGGWEGGSGFTSVSLEIQKLITRNLCGALSADNGVLLISYPTNFLRNEAGPDWIAGLSRSGIDVRIVGTEVKFVKHPGDPKLKL